MVGGALLARHRDKKTAVFTAAFCQHYLRYLVRGTTNRTRAGRTLETKLRALPGSEVAVVTHVCRG